MKIRSVFAIMVFASIFSSNVLAAKTQGVVVSIKPLHSLVSGVIGDTGEAALLLTGKTSPHDFHLKPSQVRVMQKANIIFYIDNSFETFLQSAFETLPAHVRKKAVAQDAGLIILASREGGAWDVHKHDVHEHEEKKHNHEEHEGHAHEKHDHGHDNMHVWLDVENARRIVKLIVRELSAVYPENRSIYKANAKAYIEKIDALDAELKASLKGLERKPFIVFHDAYQYFERAYGLSGVGSITFEPDESPSPQRIKEVRQKLKETGAQCVFREPQFSDRLIKTVTEGTNTKRGMLDPLGVDLNDGKDLYFSLMRDIASNLKRCLNSVR